MEAASPNAVRMMTGRDGPVQLADARAGVEAADAGEAHVQEDEVAGLAGQHLQGLLAGGARSPRGKPCRARRSIRVLGDERIVVDDQDPRHEAQRQAGPGRRASASGAHMPKRDAGAAEG